MGYKDYIQMHDKFLVQRDSKLQKALPPGHYSLSYIRELDQLIFEAIKFNHDDLLELPSKEFKLIASQIDSFLTTETKQAFETYGFIYKRSILMHGVPGTGKTCLANRVANKVVEGGGIVLFSPDPELLPMAFKALDDIQPDTNVVVVFEELDQLIRHDEAELLNILDGEVQKDNIIYIGTTNFISKIPARIMRPGRFSSVVEVFYPDAKCRKYYLDKKIGKTDSAKEIKELVKVTDGFSIDEVKEVVLSIKCLDIKLEDVVARIKETKELCKNDIVFQEGGRPTIAGGQLSDYSGGGNILSKIRNGEDVGNYRY